MSRDDPEWFYVLPMAVLAYNTEVKPTWMDLPDSEDSNSIATIIQITQDSDVPIHGTAGAAAYDVLAKGSTKLPPQTVTKVP